MLVGCGYDDKRQVQRGNLQTTTYKGALAIFLQRSERVKSLIRFKQLLNLQFSYLR